MWRGVLMRIRIMLISFFAVQNRSAARRGLFLPTLRRSAVRVFDLVLFFLALPRVAKKCWFLAG